MGGVREQAEALIVDLDGVVRVFHPGVAASAERRNGLPPGSVTGAAFAWSRLRPVIVGEQTHADWVESIAVDLARAGHDEARARAAVMEWQEHRGEIVAEVRDFIGEIRTLGVPVVLATNATSQLDADLKHLGVADDFDAVINSSVVGAHKPTREFFAAACAAVDAAPSRCLFVDDDDRNVQGARAAGLSAFRWTGPADLRYIRAALAL